jgi:hypothetical protein
MSIIYFKIHESSHSGDSREHSAYSVSYLVREREKDRSEQLRND